MKLPGPLQRLLVVSPHCDDAVFSCGELLAVHPGSVVVTVFAAGPSADEPLTEWDRAAGFEPGDDVMARRRKEDARALSLLSAQPLWLEFHDSQYRRTPTSRRISEALGTIIRFVQPHGVFVPWGLFHSDHRLASDACLAVRHTCIQPAWFFYEDAIYRRIPGLLTDRVVQARRAGHYARPITLGGRGDGRRKRQAIQCYTSQLRALTSRGRPGYLDAFEPERFWLIAPAGAQTSCARIPRPPEALPCTA
jgi:LmbE family N-acetylglucosaminyl deacetylase